MKSNGNCNYLVYFSNPDPKQKNLYHEKISCIFPKKNCSYVSYLVSQENFANSNTTEINYLNFLKKKQFLVIACTSHLVSSTLTVFKKKKKKNPSKNNFYNYSKAFSFSFYNIFFLYSTRLCFSFSGIFLYCSRPYCHFFLFFRKTFISFVCLFFVAILFCLDNI